MMKKQTSPATKNDLEEVRIDLNGKFDRLADKFFELDEKIEARTEVLKNEAKQYHNDIMTKLDSIVGQIQKFRDEYTVLAYRQKNHTDRIENLETKVFGKPSES